MSGPRLTTRNGFFAGLAAVAAALIALWRPELLQQEVAPTPAQAKSPQVSGEVPFDYYVLALSWSPSYCKLQPNSRQCGRGHRFVLHGLWPNFERGYPKDCATERAYLPDELLREYSDLTPSRGLLAHQWRKHGACSGLSARGYFEASRAALEAVRIPQVLRKLDKDLTIAPKVAEAAFLEANPDMTADGVTVTCKSGRLSEIRICLTPDLQPRACAPDTRRDCSQRAIGLPAPR